MSKKDFVALADALRESKPTGNDLAVGVAINQWEADVTVLASFCRSQNPRFDEARWRGYLAGTNGPSGGRR